MSPLVQRQRGGSSRRPDSADQHWSMLLFESLSAGVLAVFVGLVAVLTAVGVYAVFVWPLTFWNGANLTAEEYRSWANTILWSVFAGGTLAGYWCFSGHAFKRKAKPRLAVRSTSGRR